MSMWPRTRNTQPLPSRASEADTPPRTPRRLVIPDEEMRALLADGKAKPLSRIVTSFVRHDGQWWLDATGEWLAITDDAYATRLDSWATA